MATTTLGRSKAANILIAIIMAILCSPLQSLNTLPSLARHSRCLRQGSSRRENVKLSAAEITPSDASEIINTFVPPDVGPEIWAGSIIALLPIVYAAVLFTERVLTQRRCLICNGTGLVWTTSQGSQLKKPRKCNNCGGMLPWMGWKYFFFSSIFEIGNGGVLRFPSPNYKEVNEKERLRRLEGGEEGDASIQSISGTGSEASELEEES